MTEMKSPDPLAGDSSPPCLRFRRGGATPTGEFYVPVFVTRGHEYAVAARILAQQLVVRLGNPELQVDGTLGGLRVRTVD